MHKDRPPFMSERGGVPLKPGDGVIHSWLNRLLLPDTVGTGGDSHTRFPIGISFPAGSGLVAFAGAMGFMPLDMPESVLVRFKGKLNTGITLRDSVNAIPFWAIKQGLLTVPKKNKVNIFNGRILEMEGLPDLTVEQAFELTDDAAVIEINLADIKEPILACPNDPDDVKLLSKVAGTEIQDVFLGSCMTNIGHFRAAAEIWRGQKFNPEVRTWICPPTRMDQAQLKDEAYFAVYSAFGARIEIAGCSLCMGNQARVPDGVNMFSTSTRNFDDRIGNGAKVYLGSAELGAVTALLGRLPKPAEFLKI